MNIYSYLRFKMNNNNLRRKVLVTIKGNDPKKLYEELNMGKGIGFSYNDNDENNIDNPKIEIYTVEK